MDINEHFQSYLGFSWGVGSRRKYYFFRVFPFGLSTACYVFTKLLRPFVKRLGLRAIVYIDDGICASSSQSEAVKSRDVVISDLKNAGFVLNDAKSHLEPVQDIAWLGFNADLRQGCFSIPSDKIERLKSSIARFSAGARVPAHSLASVVGQIISMTLGNWPHCTSAY